MEINGVSKGKVGTKNMGPTKTGSQTGAGAVITKTGSLRGRPIF